MALQRSDISGRRQFLAGVVLASAGAARADEKPAAGLAEIKQLLAGKKALTWVFTGDSITGAGARMSYFAPVFGWHAHAMLRFAATSVRPHLVVGGGGETVASTSPFRSGRPPTWVAETGQRGSVLCPGLRSSPAASARSDSSGMLLQRKYESRDANS